MGLLFYYPWLLLKTSFLHPVQSSLVLLAIYALLSLTGRVPLSYNFRNLAIRWRITFLTALAFTLVVAIFVVMLGFVNGMYVLTQGSAIPGNVLVLSDGATDELFSNLSYRDNSDIDLEPGVLRTADDTPLCSREVYVVANQPIANPRGQRKRRFLQIRGLDDSRITSLVHNLPLHPGGQWLSQAGVQLQDNNNPESGEVIQAILGEGIARELGKDAGLDTLKIGDIFDLGPRRWIVVGVLQSSGSTFDSEIWANRQIAGPLFGKVNYTSIVLRTENEEGAKLLATHLTKNYKKAALNAQVETEYYAKLNATNQQFLFAIIFVAIVMAVGGVFGVMNTMFAAISQRINDIAVLRIIGYTRWQILVSFFLESIGIAILGGLLGCALGSVADGWTASSIMSGGQGGGKSVVLKLTVDLITLARGFLFTLFMGMLGGILPAVSAMRLKPLESMR